MERVQDTDIPVPGASRLLPPLLWCLYPGSWSESFPVALNDLITPILRQRVKLLYEAPASRFPAEVKETWLYLLCWDEQEALAVGDLLGAEGLQLDRVTGKVEFKDPDPPRLRRSDEETLLAKFILKDLGLEIFYTWCPDDREGPHKHWKVSELRTHKGEKDEQQDGWYATIAMANQAFSASGSPALPRNHPANPAGPSGQEGSARPDERMEDAADDLAYWNRYDNPSGAAPVEERPPPLPYVTMRAGPAPVLAEDNRDEQGERSSEAQWNMFSDVSDEIDPDHHFGEMLHSISGQQPLRPFQRDRSAEPLAPETAIREHIFKTVLDMREYFRDTVDRLQRLAESVGMDLHEFESLIVDATSYGA